MTASNRTPLILVLASFSMVCGCQTAPSVEERPQPIRFTKECLSHNTSDEPPAETCRKTIHIGRGVDLPVSIVVTEKGNGSLEIGNLQMRCYDAHDDGAVYADWLLNTVFVDLSGDGYLDLVVAGNAIQGGDKGGALDLKAGDLQYVPLMAIFIFVPTSGSYREAYRQDDRGLLHVDLKKQMKPAKNSR